MRRVGFPRLQAVLLQGRVDAREHGLGRIVGRGRQLVRRDDPALRIDQHDVGKRPTGVDAEGVGALSHEL